jgi:hypothetical protein
MAHKPSSGYGYRRTTSVGADCLAILAQMRPVRFVRPTARGSRLRVGVMVKKGNPVPK